MKLQIAKRSACLPVLLFWLSLLPGWAFAQSGPTGSVKGQISDPSGAGVPAARVVAVSATGQVKAGTVKPDGTYEISGLAAGTYTIRARAKGFSPFEQASVVVVAGKSVKVDIALQISQEVEKVDVTDTTTQVSVNPTENATSLVIKGEDLQALSDDPDELQSELEALAGPSAGPNGGQIYVDGFTAGQLPPKADILEVRINQNPFSAEYDKLGYGRIEITTRPGSAQFHGQLMGSLGLSQFDTRNPFAVDDPAYHSDFYNANVGGPLGKKASFFFSFFRRGIEDNSVVSASVLNQTTLLPESFNQAVASPRSLTNLSPRFDLQLTNSNVLSIRYQYYDNNTTNGDNSVGQLSLASQGLNTHSDEHTVQISDTDVISAKKLNQFRFQYLHDDATTNPASLAAAINVQGAFLMGGNTTGTSTDIQNHYEAQNLTSFFIGKHTLVVGGRVRDEHDTNTSNANFNGTFTFASLPAYQTAEMNLQACAAGGGTNCQTSGATQFLIVGGNPLSSVNLLDVGLFAQDDWKLNPNLTLSLGLRWETQTGIADHSDFAPRVGLAWGIGSHKKAPKTVLRAGFGIFYDRFPETLLLNAERLNGTTQQTYLVPSPDFFPIIPSLSSLSGQSNETPSRYEIDPNLHAPYTMQSAIGIEQQVSKNANVSVTYLNAHGVRQLFANDINSPIPGTFPLGDPTAITADRPFGNSAGNIYDYQSGGLFNQNQFIANFNVRLGTKLTLGGFYTLSYANADSSGNTPAVIMNPYDIHQDYGRAEFDVRNRLVLIGNWNLPRRFSLSPFLVTSSGSPFNVTEPTDLFGTGQFNARPALGTACTVTPVTCPLGVSFITPTTAQSIIAPYSYDNPGQFTFNLRLAKTFGFGRELSKSSNVGGGGRGGPGGGPGGGGGGRGGPGGGPGGGGLGGRGLSGGGGMGGFFGGGGTASNRRFNLTLSVNARNMFNDVNLGPRVSIVGSSLFGQSNSIGGLFGGGFGGGLQAANRRIDFGALFTF